MVKYTRSDLKPGIFFSPAFYLAYWDNIILPNFPSEVIISNAKLKPYREMWLGAILAAAQTKASGIKHFVGLPESEPPDIDIVKFQPIKTPKGGLGTSLDRLNVEITRCSLDEGEDLYTQIIKKNKPAYQDMILAVYVYGDKREVDFDSLFVKLEKVKLFQSEVVIIAMVGLSSTPNGSVKTFSVSKVWPIKGETIFSSVDAKAFFRHPEVSKQTQRGIGRVWKDLGSFELMPPKI